MPILEQVTKAKRQAEIDAILAALDSTRWNRKQAAAILEIDYKSLLYKIKKLGIEDRPRAFSERPHPPLQRTASGD
jgi:two-component system response regulator AtoC